MLIVYCVTWCHTDEGDEEEDDREAVECFGGEVEAEHCVNCPETKESEELNIILES